MRLSKPIAFRIIVDILLVNLSFMIVVAGRLLLLFWSNAYRTVDVALFQSLIIDSTRLYANSAILLTIMCPIMFYFSGFYTHGRNYRSRYKALVVAQAVTLSYLIFAAISFSFSDIFPVPRSVLVASCIVTLGSIGGARLAASAFLATDLLIAKTEAPPQQRVKRTLVIGGAGYIGSVMVRKLLQKGYKVRVLDALLYGQGSLAELDGHENLEIIKGDFRHIETVVSAMRGVDAVIHLGAIVGDPACDLDERVTVEINLTSTKMIAEVAKGFGVERFVFASTCGVYGASEETLTEKSGLNPQSLYSRTKIGSEQALMKLAGSRFAPTIMRLATVYGMSHRVRFDLVVNLLTAKAYLDKKITIFGGDQWRPFIHVDDAAEAFVSCLSAPIESVRNRVLNLGSDDQNYRIRDIGNIIAKIIPDTNIEEIKQDADSRNYRVSFSEIKKHLGFLPSKTVADGVTEIVAALDGGVVGDYLRSEYSNFVHLRENDRLADLKADDSWAY